LGPFYAIQKLPRGIPLNQFSPSTRGLGYGKKFGGSRPVRFLFVGRFLKKRLAILGNFGTYCAKKQILLTYVCWERLVFRYTQAISRIARSSFCWRTRWETLASLYADADYFIFLVAPILWNVVVEALALAHSNCD
jgi:hypothetical protein